MTYIDEMIKELCPDGVEWKELGKVCVVKTGQSVNKTFIQNNSGDYPVINSGKEPLGYVDVFNTEDDPIGITSRGAGVGYVSWNEGKYFRGNLNYSATVKDSEKLLPRYLYYFLKNNSKKIEELCTFDGIPALNKSKLENLNIAIPHEDIQKEIVKILDKFTDYVTELTAELTFRQKQYEYYREAIIGFKTQKHQFVRLSDISSYSKEKIVNTQIPKGNYIGVENLLQNKRGFVKKELELAPGNSTMFSPGSTLIGNIRPYLKKILYADFFGGTNGDVLVVDILDSCKEFIDSKYLYYCLSSDYFFNFMNQNSRGAKMPRGDKNKIMEFELPLPSLEEQKQIVMILDKFESLVYSIQDGLPKLIEEQQKQYVYYRQNLLSFDEMEGKQIDINSK